MKSFKLELGIKAKSKVYGIDGIITARSENMYGCNRYFIQPPAGKDGKISEGAWFDEDDITKIGKGLSSEVISKDTGGPASKLK